MSAEKRDTSHRPRSEPKAPLPFEMGDLTAEDKTTRDRAWAAMYDHYAPMVDRITRARTGGRPTNETHLDAARETWLAVVEGVYGDKYNSPSHLEGSINKIAWNKGVDERRKEQKAKEDFVLSQGNQTDAPEATALERVPIPHPTLEDQVVDHIVLGAVVRSLTEGLTDKQRGALIDVVVQGMDHAESAEEQDTTVGGSRLNLSKAMKKVRDTLADETGIVINPKESLAKGRRGKTKDQSITTETQEEAAPNTSDTETKTQASPSGSTMPVFREPGTNDPNQVSREEDIVPPSTPVGEEVLVGFTQPEQNQHLQPASPEEVLAAYGMEEPVADVDQPSTPSREVLDIDE